MTLLVVTAEVFLRISGWAKSPITPIALPGEEQGLFRYDADTFWSFQPDRRIELDDVTIKTNSLGLRGEQIAKDKGDNYRILSLGESTTFGFAVENDETYSYLIQQQLNQDSPQRFEVINAGVTAYTSFQSLQYLKTRGIDLKPDMILAYHEINDYLPTYMRSSKNTVIGMGLTDQQRFESRSRQRSRALLSKSAIYRFIRYRSAYSKLQDLLRDPDAELAMELAIVDGREQPMQFPTRVSSKERLSNLIELKRICDQHSIKLVIIHPSYRATVPHQCLLTEFCKDHDVQMIEIQDVLHPEGANLDDFFVDRVHPTALGHRRIAERVAQVIQKTLTVPGD